MINLIWRFAHFDNQKTEALFNILSIIISGLKVINFENLGYAFLVLFRLDFFYIIN